MNRSAYVLSPRSHLVLLFLNMFGLITNMPVLAHDGHVPLPSKGATVQGNQLMLSEPARKAIAVESAKITLKDLNKTVRAQAQVQLPWHQQAQVTTLMAGRIRQVLARPGDQVEKDQVLALVECLELETIQRDLAKANAESSLAKRLLAQREELARNNTIAMTTVLETRREAEETDARVEIAIRKLLALGLTQANVDQVIASGVPIRILPIRSPIKGEVVSTEVRSGQVVATDEHLFHIVDLSAVEIAGQVLESDVPQVVIGQPVNAVFTSLPGKSFAGYVEHTQLAIDVRSRTLRIIAHVENPHHLLKPGMSGQMAIDVASVKQAIVCPKAAISGTPEAPFVFMERAPGRYDRRRVKIGLRVGHQTEILDGLFPGDRVVVVGTGVLSNLFPPFSDPVDKMTKIEIPQSTVDRAIRGKSTELPDQPVVALGEVEVPVHHRHFAASQVEGRIARILVHPGEDVKAGQILAEVESLPVYELQLDLLQNIARAKWIREKTVRLRALQDSQAVKKVDLWQSETDLDVIDHTIEEIRMKLRSLGMDEPTLKSIEALGLDPGGRAIAGASTIPIRAPADGRIDHFEVVPGQVVRPSDAGQSVRNKPLFEIHDRSKVWICAHVRERDASRIRAGQTATVLFPSISGKSVQGTVIRISPVFDEKTRVMPVWIEAENKDGQLFENMQAKVLIDTSRLTDPANSRKN